ncbi:MAG: chemotaxis protein CheW, partial [Leptolyngbyaceae cyanobacterium MAG.088]|nr:chemotaxis protein CheW [Leptolyngbyaceae cyanobacterium MAG.088]
MTMDPDIRDQAYQFFIEEASELLDTIENGLLNLRPDVSVQKVHEIMRAAHSIKGGAASVDLDTIKTIAHRLEDSFKALYSDTVVVDAALETLLLRAYDCLRHPLQAQLDTGTFNEKQALAVSESIFSELETCLGPALDNTDSFMPSAADLGVDIVASIFEVDVAEVLAQLKNIVTTPQDYDCSQELQSQLEVLTGFAELVDIPEFTNITTTAQAAINKHLHQPLPVIEQVINNVDRARTAVLSGNRANFGGPSDGLLTLAGAEGNEINTPSVSSLPKPLDEFELPDINLDILDQEISYDIDASAIAPSDSMAEQLSSLEEIWTIEAEEFPSVEKIDDSIGTELTSSNVDALTDVWGDATSITAELNELNVDESIAETESSHLDALANAWGDDTTSIAAETETDNSSTTGPAASHLDALANAWSDVAESKPDEGNSIVSEPEPPNLDALANAWGDDTTSIAATDEDDNITLDPASSNVDALENVWSDATPITADLDVDDSIASEAESSNLDALTTVWSDATSTSLDENDNITPAPANVNALANTFGDATSTAAEPDEDNNIASETGSSNVDTLANTFGDATSTSARPDIEVTDFEALIADTPSESIMESWTPSATTDLPDQETNDKVKSVVNFVDEVYSSLPKFPKQLGEEKAVQPKKKKAPTQPSPKSQLSAKVPLERLERMNNLVGELAINRNSLSLQNDQFQRTVHQLGRRFSSFRFIVKQLQSISDQILVSPNQQSPKESVSSAHTKFDSLEMDSYSEINSLLEGVLEEVFQLAESIDDVALFAGQSNQLLKYQRLTLKQLRNELMWSRMVPLEKILKRFPRVIRELSNSYEKPVQLTLKGTEVLVDRVMLEKLYDPLLHLLRNAFDHGIESPDIRQSLDKSAQGNIELRAYHQGNYTVIEIEDDGRGIDTDKVVQQAIEAQLLSPEQITTMPKQQIQQLIFEPGFSTANEVSELSGRGVGLDIVKANLQTFNGKLSLTTRPGSGTTFSLKIPLTLTLTKLVIGNTGRTTIAVASDSIEEILKPVPEKIKQSVGKRFLHWRSQLIPVYDCSSLLSYQCLDPRQVTPRQQAVLKTIARQKTMLIIQQGQERIALELEQILTEQELVIKPMGKAIAAPSYINGCTVLADGSLVPVIDGAALVQFEATPSVSMPPPQVQPSQSHALSHTLMIIDDSSALRRTLALTLRKAGYQVLQAKDGRDAIEQLQQG